MFRRQGKAPSYAKLRPIKRQEDDTFPVYKRLADQLVAVKPGTYDPVAAHVCAVASGWAYAERAAIATMVARLGLDENLYFQACVYNDAMFIASNAFVIQSKCGRVVILCYRGTEPRNFINWLTDADINPTKLPFPIGKNSDAALRVHGGFYRNFRATWYEVAQRLKRAAAGQSILDTKDGGTPAKMDHPMKALFVTGHSLGAAMAALAAVRIAADEFYAAFEECLSGVYTFGQPMVGDAAFAKACNAHAFLKNSVFRHVYANDLVPCMPPAVTGAFGHFGKEYRAHEGACWAASARSSSQAWGGLVTTMIVPAVAFLTKQFTWTKSWAPPYSWYDHSPTYYIASSTPPQVESEFQAKGGRTGRADPRSTADGAAASPQLRALS